MWHFLLNQALRGGGGGGLRRMKKEKWDASIMTSYPLYSAIPWARLYGLWSKAVHYLEWHLGHRNRVLTCSPKEHAFSRWHSYERQLMLTGVSQRRPVNPSRQAQAYPATLSELSSHSPPFLHGLGSQDVPQGGPMDENEQLVIG